MSSLYQMKIDAARACVDQHLALVGSYYRERAEALAAAEAVIRKDERLDSAQIAEALRGPKERGPCP